MSWIGAWLEWRGVRYETARALLARLALRSTTGIGSLVSAWLGGLSTTAKPYSVVASVYLRLWAQAHKSGVFQRILSVTFIITTITGRATVELDLAASICGIGFGLSGVGVEPSYHYS
jgi:hypothetical protein